MIMIVLIYRCRLPNELANASYSLPPDIMNTSYPFDYNTGSWSSCKLYDTNFMDTSFNHTSNRPRNLQTRYCDQWIYDRSEFQNTAVMEVNMSNTSNLWLC